MTSSQAEVAAADTVAMVVPADVEMDRVDLAERHHCDDCRKLLEQTWHLCQRRLRMGYGQFFHWCMPSLSLQPDLGEPYWMSGT